MRRSPRLARIGRDFTFAMLLLTLGIALPLAVSINQRRHLATIRQAQNQSGPTSQPTATDQAPSLSSILPTEQSANPLGIVAPIVAALLPTATANTLIPTLIPIVPTATPIVPVPAPEPPQPLTAASQPIPILMYHYIRVVDESVDPLGYSLSVTPELFEAQMQWLTDHGYTGITVDQAIRCMHGEPICPLHSVAISFDDGYSDAYAAALPVLQKHGFKATFYIVYQFVDQPSYLTWPEVIGLHQAGMEIGSHTLTHEMLTRLPYDQITHEVVDSKQLLEQRIGAAVTSFCYPVGDYDATVVEQVRAAGYSNAVTTRWDNNYADMLTLPRRRVAGGTDAESFGWIVTS